MPTLLEKTRTLFTNVVNTILPIACVSCGTIGDYVCEYCLENLHAKSRIQTLLVNMIELPVLSLQTIHTKLIREIIHLYKYDCVIQASGTIKRIVQKLYTELPNEEKKAFTENVIFVPIPLHTSRLKWRGYNQSRTIAQALLEESDGKINTNNTHDVSQYHAKLKVDESKLANNNRLIRLLNRSLKTKTQVGKTQHDRHENLKNAFTLNFDAFKGLKGAKTIVLVDDVVTTGSTLIEAATILKHRLPYSRIIAITLAQAPLNYTAKNGILL